jgi:hypothetical protein
LIQSRSPITMSIRAKCRINTGPHNINRSYYRTDLGLFMA